MMSAFTQFVNMVESRGMYFHYPILLSFIGLIDCDTLPSTASGTRAYILTARQPADRATAAAIDDDECNVFAAFPEMTPADSFYCAMMANGYAGHADLAPLIAMMGPITSIIGTRVQFMRKSRTAPEP